MILGTHTSRTAQDYLMIAEVILPKPSHNEGDPLGDYDQEKGGELDMPYNGRSILINLLAKKLGPTTPTLRRASRSFSASTILMRSTVLVTCLRMQI